MARKDLLKGLMGEPRREGAPDATPPDPAPRPHYARGAVGAVSQSIADLRNRALIEVPTDRIDAGGLRDRLGEDPDAFEALRVSLRDHGQQVPVLLRRHPEDATRYQVVYGRRRVAAMAALGQPVKALLRELDDRDLIIAQGQENAARRDLTFIEKANFARQMREAGFERKVICAALHIDKTVISRMLAVTDAVPLAVIEAIGPAPAAGRDRWRAVADGVARNGATAPDMLGLLEALPATEGSDRRFEALLAWLARSPSRKTSAAKTAQMVTGADGRPIARHKRGQTGLTLSFDMAETGDFADWLLRRLPDLHRDWLDRRDDA